MKSIREMVSVKRKNNNVIITIATYAYRHFTVDFYRRGNPDAFDSFFVVTQDKLTYNVLIESTAHP